MVAQQTGSDPAGYQTDVSVPERRIALWTVVWLLVAFACAAAPLYLHWHLLVEVLPQALIALVVFILASAVRLPVAAGTRGLTLGIGPLALTILYLGPEYAWVTYGVWVIGAVLGCAWTQRIASTVGTCSLVAAVAGAVLVYIRSTFPAVGEPMEFLNPNGEAVAIVLSVLACFLAVMITTMVSAKVQLGSRSGALLSGLAWTRILAITVTQALGGVIGYGLTQMIPGDFGVLAVTGPFTAGVFIVVGIVAVSSVSLSTARYWRLSERERILTTSLVDLPWPSTPPVEEQTEQKLKEGLRRFEISTTRSRAAMRRLSTGGRVLVSEPVEDGRGAFVAVVRRGPFTPPFTVSDQRFVNALAAIARTSVKTDREIEELRTLSASDLMTGLPNYRALRRQLVDVQESGAERGLAALIFINVQNLARINAEYSPEVGDEVLRALAERLRTLSEQWPGASVYRIAGDEFGVLVTSLRSRREVTEIAWEYDSGLGEPVETEKGLVSVVLAQTTAVAGMEAPGQMAELVQRADGQMYRSRRKFVNMAVDEANGAEMLQGEDAVAGAQARLAATGPTAALVEAIRGDRLRQVYEPIVDRIGGRIVAVEAAVRYTDPVYGSLSVQFLRSESARLGLRTKMVIQIMHHAVADMRRFRQICPELRRLHLNLTPAQLVDREFTSDFERIRTENPELEIVLELDADTLRVAPEETDNKAAAYAVDHNVLIALDNSGTSYSELSSMIRYPVFALKVSDRLLAGVKTKRVRDAMGRYLSAITSTGVRVIVCGVSTTEEVEFLDQLGVRYADGPLYGNPVSASEFLVRLGTLGLNLS